MGVGDVRAPSMSLSEVPLSTSIVVHSRQTGGSKFGFNDKQDIFAIVTEKTTLRVVLDI